MNCIQCTKCTRIKGWKFYVRCLSLSGLWWAKKPVFLLGTLTIMIIDCLRHTKVNCNRFMIFSKQDNFIFFWIKFKRKNFIPKVCLRFQVYQIFFLFSINWRKEKDLKRKNIDTKSSSFTALTRKENLTYYYLKVYAIC